MEYARGQGAEVFGSDIVGVGNKVDYIHADLTDLGQAYDAIYGADAIIHLGAIVDSGMFTDARTFLTNTASTYHVFLAAARLGVRRVVWASSVQVNHTVPAQRCPYRYFPLDEDHPVDPQSDYALSKYVGEVAADYFARNFGLTIVSLRFTYVVPLSHWAELPMKEGFGGRFPLPHYVHIHDAARACYLAAAAPLPPGSHTVALITARDTFVDMPTAQFLDRYYPDVERRKTFEGYESLISGARAEAAFGFVAQHSCRD